MHREDPWCGSSLAVLWGTLGDGVSPSIPRRLGGCFFGRIR